jgi:hypothetical protein
VFNPESGEVVEERFTAMKSTRALSGVRGDLGMLRD